MSEFKEIVVKPHFNFVRILFSSGMLPTLIIFISLLPLIAMAAVPFLVISLLVLLITEFAVYMNYRATTYKILDDKIEFNEGFINHQSMSVKFKNIKEIHLTQSFIQRIFKLGTIRILTAGSNEDNGGGLKLLDIDSSASFYTFLNKHLNSTFNKAKTETKDKVYSLKPDYSSNYYTLLAFCSSIPAIIILNVILITIYSILVDLGNNVIVSSAAILCSNLIFFALSIIIFKSLYKLEYKNRKYLVSSTRIESKEGFFNYHYTTICMKNIKEIRMERGFFQRKFGLGSIIISTPANNSSMQRVTESNILASMITSNNSRKQMNYYTQGIRINNLNEVLKIYKWLKYMNDYAVSENSRNIANDTPQYTYKPTFKLFAQVSLYPCALFVLIWSLFSSFGGFISFIINLAIMSFIFLFIPQYLKKKNYDCSKYEIYPTRIEFHEGYIKNKTSMILIENISEIHVKENFIQKIFKLSTIKIVTSGSTDAISRNDSGEIFRDIINGQEVYTTLKQLIKDKKENKVEEVTTETTSQAIQTNTVVANKQEFKEKLPVSTMTFTPKFIFLNVFLSQFFIITASIMFLVLIFAVQAEDLQIGTTIKVLFIGLIISALLSAVLSIVISIVDGLNYKATKYEFLDDKINFTEGFFNNNYTSLEYKNIREISLVQNLSQRIFNLGSINIATAANTSFSGLRLRDIQQSSEIYKKLEDNIKAFSATIENEVSPIMEFKPKYKVMYAFFCYAIPSAFLTLIFLGSFKLSFLAFIIAFIAMGIKHNCQQYKIYSDKIEFSFSFINKHSTIIFNEKLREIHLKRGFMQRLFGIGTFSLVTAASGGKGNKFFNVADTENINKILKEIESRNEK